MDETGLDHPSAVLACIPQIANQHLSYLRGIITQTPQIRVCDEERVEVKSLQSSSESSRMGMPKNRWKLAAED